MLTALATLDSLTAWRHPISCWIEHHPGLASWVQAVGSIVAIVVAFVIANAQTRASVRRERAADVAEARVCLYIFDAVSGPFERAVDYKRRDITSEESIAMQHEVAVFTGAFAALQNYPVHTIKTPLAADVLFRSRSLFVLNIGFTSVISTNKLADADISKLDAALKDISDMRKKLVDCISSINHS